MVSVNAESSDSRAKPCAIPVLPATPGLSVFREVAVVQTVRTMDNLPHTLLDQINLGLRIFDFRGHRWLCGTQHRPFAAIA